MKHFEFEWKQMFWATEYTMYFVKYVYGHITENSY